MSINKNEKGVKSLLNNFQIKNAKVLSMFWKCGKKQIKMESKAVNKQN
jgi:hypothetical protein